MKTEEAWNGLYSVGGGGDDKTNNIPTVNQCRKLQHSCNIIFESTGNHNPVSPCEWLQLIFKTTVDSFHLF